MISRKGRPSSWRDLRASRDGSISIDAGETGPGSSSCRSTASSPACSSRIFAIENTTVSKRFELARQMHAAKHLLTRGGIVFNVPDARQNLDNSRSVEFFGRQRGIATGFAELALKTGAHVMPIAYRFSPRGFFVLEFGAPFHVLGPQSSHDERVDSLIGQYANFLRDEWRRYPWNIHWEHLRYYCELPEVDPGTLSEK